MTVGELKKKLEQFDNEATVVTVVVPRPRERAPEVLEDVFSGADLAVYDRQFIGKVVIW